MNITPSLYSFWGKASSNHTPNTSTRVHPAICHMLDVGLVSQALLEQASTTLNDLLLHHFHGSVAEKIKWLAFIVALHDLGKISPGFQSKRQDLIQSLPTEFAFSQHGDEPDHGRVTFDTLPELLESIHLCSRPVGKLLARTIAAHHGQFHAVQNRQKRKNVGQGAWNTARAEIVNALLTVFELPPPPIPWNTDLTTDFLITLAGLTTVADWIGSDVSQFDYVGDSLPVDLSHYAQTRLEIARRLVKQLHLKQPKVISTVAGDFKQLFALEQPNECQQVSLAIAQQLAGAASLIIIETPMGSGKTEAALNVSDWWLRAMGAEGIYYALPTQATANQLFKRVEQFISRNPAIEAGAELHLLHAYAELQDHYQQLQLTAIDNDETATIKASHWFISKKRGLLSPFAVGTVDQALLAALQVRHLFVRLYGLAGKVVIIDEVHAYDTYTSKLLDRLLTWLAYLNTSVILLSATLPEKRRRELLQAYVPQLALTAQPQYPGIIGVNRHGQQLIQAVTTPTKTLQLELIHTPLAAPWAAIGQILVTQLNQGGCAAIILNTVTEAQALFSYLQEQISPLLPNTPLVLFHARFPLQQRLALEDKLAQLFGKHGQRPPTAIVVATQVLEQSLDVDFDLMITALAPIDLMLQRAGRLHRHDNPRPTPLAQATLYCLQADLTVKAPQFGLSAEVYEPITLLRTALVLENYDHQALRLPAAVSDLIESVYGSKVIHYPENLTNTAEDWEMLAHGLAKQVKFIAQENSLPPPTEEDFFEQLADFMEDDDLVHKTQTRLTRPSITIIVLHQIHQQVYLDTAGTQPINLAAKHKPSPELTKALLLNSVTISHPSWYNYFHAKTELPPGWKQSPVLRYCRAALFENNQLINNSTEILKINPELGLVFN